MLTHSSEESVVLPPIPLLVDTRVNVDEFHVFLDESPGRANPNLIGRMAGAVLIDLSGVWVANMLEKVTLLVRLLDRPEMDEVFPSVFHRLLSLFDEGQNTEVQSRLVKHVLPHPRITVGHLGQVDQYVLDRHDEVAVTWFRARCFRHLPLFPLRVKLETVFQYVERQAGAVTRMKVANDLLTDRFTLEQIEQAFPTCVGFPVDMQLSMILGLRDQVAYPDEWLR